MNLQKLLKQYIDVILYLVFGVLTTAINVLSYWILAHSFSLSVMTSTVIAWFIAVSFAYITNRKWVFQSNAFSVKDIMKEMFSFFTCRIATGGVDWIIMFVFVDIMGLNDVGIKVLSNIIVIVLNYIASKLVIFKKHESR